MKIISLFIGNELLNGQTPNKNLISLGNGLMRAGYRLDGSETIPDDRQLILSAVKRNALTAEVILICGGLGPTADDITRESVAAAVGAQLDHSEDVRSSLEKYMEYLETSPSGKLYKLWLRGNQFAQEKSWDLPPYLVVQY